MSIADSERLRREIMLGSMFPSMPGPARARFVELLEETEVAAGKLVFDLGDPPDRLLFLIEGRVKMEHPNLRAWEFAPIAVVGVIDAVLERPRMRSCRTLEACRFFSLRVSDWFDMLEDNGQTARAAIRNFATQLHRQWRQVASRLARKSELPPPLLGPELELYDKILALRRAPALRSAGMQAIASLAAVAEPVALERGQTLFELDGYDDSLYFVVKGTIELSSAGGFRYDHQRGDLIGGAAAFCHALPAYAARALTDALVLRISEQDFYDQAEEHGRLTRGALKYLVSDLEQLLTLDDQPSPAVAPQGIVSSGA
jgi:CRP-like cAMP-binding protein